MTVRPLGELKGLGVVSVRWLGSVGIADEGDLRALGSVEAYARVRMAAAPGASLNLLYALEAALREVDWRSLPPELRASLAAKVGRSCGGRAGIRRKDDAPVWPPGLSTPR
ncbi:MAG: TfoX/Sxy family DNA transformation protein [Brevundimonas sp.]